MADHPFSVIMFCLAMVCGVAIVSQGFQAIGDSSPLQDFTFLELDFIIYAEFSV